MIINTIKTFCYVLSWFIFVIPQLAANTPAHEIYYQIDPGENVHCLHVTAKFQGNKSGSEFIIVPNYVKNTRVSMNGKGSVQPTSIPSVGQVFYPANSPIQFQYDYCIDNLTRTISAPIVEKDLFYLPLEQILITPYHATQTPSKIQINISSLAKGQAVISSFNVQQQNFVVNESIETLRTAMIAGGNIKIETLLIKGKPIYIASTGSWNYFDHKPSYYLDKLITLQRNFWNDHDFDHYAIFLIGQKKNALSPTIDATHLHNAFAVRLPENYQAKDKVIYILSHELFHAWLGRKMKISSKHSDVLWFFEGFNDYYGLQFALQSGLISLHDYIEINNNFIKSFYLSPLKEYTGEALAQFSAQKIPYRMLTQIRGHFAAKKLAQITDNLGNPILDKAMQDLYHQYKMQDKPYLTSQDLQLHFNYYFGNQWQRHFDTINTGCQIQLSPTAFAPQAQVKQTVINAPDYHFNIQKFLEKDVIADLERNSPEYEAGLRNGQKVIDFDAFLFNTTKRNITIVVEENGKSKNIKFIPRTKIIKTPQYQLVKWD